MGLLGALNRTWNAIAGQASENSNDRRNASRPDAPLEMRDELLREIGRLSSGHRSNLCDDPTYLRLLRERGIEICQNGDRGGNPLIEDLVAQVQSLEEQLQLQLSRSDLTSAPH